MIQSSLQVAQAESDSLRASTLKAVRDDQEHNGAYQQALQRITTLDSEVAKYKAECYVLRKDREEQALEMRKLQSNASFTGDRLSITESEARRLKSQLHVRAFPSLSLSSLPSFFYLSSCYRSIYRSP